jgi:large subunit ribosomal protein L4
MQVKTLNFNNESTGDINLPAEIFGLTPIRPDILSRVIHWQLAKRRAGTHKTKGVSEISGTGKKPYKQKGTGNARQGSLRSPQFRGGATIFGPVVRSHGYSLNKKIRKLGLKMALSDRAQLQQVIVLDDLPNTPIKTKDAAQSLAQLGIKNALFIVPNAGNDNFLQAVRNIPHIDVIPVCGANVYSIMGRHTLVLTKDSLKELEERLA